MKNDPIEILAAHMEIEAAFLQECLEEGAVSLAEITENAPAVAPARLARLRRLQRLCRGLDVDPFAGAIIVDLLEQLDETRRELERRRL